MDRESLIHRLVARKMASGAAGKPLCICTLRLRPADAPNLAPQMPRK
jgi:hypothetical protein